MSETKFTSVQAEDNCVNPTLIFGIDVYYDNQISYACIQSGRLFSQDGSRVGQVALGGVNRDPNAILDFLQSEIADSLVGKPERERREYVKLYVELTPAAVARIENSRHKNHEKTVALQLEVDVISYEGKMLTLTGHQPTGMQYRPRLVINRKGLYPLGISSPK